ncbi:hypothetical protein EJD97_017892 [Solanum chilense]|uniref:Uncharacterized protein n=1 Tax=Solanum chilense TaxID=4083 RepID=A0A6N2CJ86_SOLCI|nr:hypothetical protein EJD97_017892 [Solanum chilense]
MEKEVLRLNTMDLHILWTLLIGGVVADPGRLGEFLVLMVLLPFITKTWNQSIMWLPMNNMKVWPTSNNPIVKSPKIRKLSGRPGKVRIRKAVESRKIGKLSKRGPVMTCSKCGTQATESVRGKGTGRATREIASGRGVPAQSHGNATNTETINGRGTGTCTGRGAGSWREMALERYVNEGISRGRGMTQHSQISSEANCSGGGLGRGKRPVEHEDTSGVQTRPFKMPIMVGVGIYQAKDGFTTLNPGLPSRRVINTGTKVTKRADVVPGDIGYTRVRGFK